MLQMFVLQVSWGFFWKIFNFNYLSEYFATNEYHYPFIKGVVTCSHTALSDNYPL